MPFDAVFQRGRPIVRKAMDVTRRHSGGGLGLMRAEPATGAISRYRDPTVRAGRHLQQFLPRQRHQIVYGSNIDNAATETESRIPNCRTRSAIAPRSSRGHLQRQGQIGQAPVKIEDDPTLQGDIVAGSTAWWSAAAAPTEKDAAPR